MPLFLSDLRGGAEKALDHPFVGAIFGNPFFSATIVTLVGLVIIFLLADDVSGRNLAMIGFALFVLSVCCFFLNNRSIIGGVRGAAENALFDFNPASDTVVSAAHRYKPAPRELAVLANGADASDDSDDEAMPAPAIPAVAMPTTGDLRALGLASAYPTNYLSA